LLEYYEVDNLLFEIDSNCWQEQLLCFSEMCLGRNYTAINKLRSAYFGYTKDIIVMCIRNKVGLDLGLLFING
jgi:hypothetical protein